MLSFYSIYTEGDRAIIHAKVPYLTKPLKHGERTEVSRGVIYHNDIIGSRVWDPIKAHKGTNLWHPEKIRLEN